MVLHISSIIKLLQKKEKRRKFDYLLGIDHALVRSLVLSFFLSFNLPLSSIHGRQSDNTISQVWRRS